jgi:hypothetical protein
MFKFKRTTVITALILSALLIVGMLFIVGIVGLGYHLYTFVRASVMQKMKPAALPTFPQSWQIRPMEKEEHFPPRNRRGVLFLIYFEYETQLNTPNGIPTVGNTQTGAGETRTLDR